MLHAFKSCSIACQYLALLKWVRRCPNRSSLKSSGSMLWPLRWLRVWCMPLMYAATVTFRWSPSVRIYASQITAVQPQLSRRCFQCRGRCRSSTSTKPILTICPMSRATSSTRSVIITKSLCPRIALACCASCTRMEPSSPKLELLGREHSNCTSWAQRTVDPTLRPPEITLLDFLYGEWGDSTPQNNADKALVQCDQIGLAVARDVTEDGCAVPGDTRPAHPLLGEVEVREGAPHRIIHEVPAWQDIQARARPVPADEVGLAVTVHIGQRPRRPAEGDRRAAPPALAQIEERRAV